MSEGPLAGQTALVTGATRGIGLAIALRLAADGAKVIGTATTDEGAAKIAALLGDIGNAGTGMKLDVADAAGTDAVLAAMRTRLGLPSDAVTARWLAALKANALEPKSGVVRDLLEQVVAEAPRFVAGHVLLADVHTARGDHDLARASYRTVLAIDPNHVIALNNLAYNLAVQAGDVDAAVPLADRLMRLGQTSPTVLDTVGWVWHLAGRSQAAAEVLSRATRTDPTLCDGLDHYAQVLTALGRSAEAARVSAQLIACRAPAAPTPPR